MKIKGVKKIGNYIYLDTDDAKYNKQQLEKIDGYGKTQIKIAVIGFIVIALTPIATYLFYTL